MELRHLRYFVLVAEELHFGRAAERAGIAQPPLSQQIRSLEAELGVQLFDRNRRHVKLTNAGRALLPEARKTLKQAENSMIAARDGAHGLTGRLTIGFVGSLAPGLLPAFISNVRTSYPGIRLDLREMTSAQQVASLKSSSLDLGLLRYPTNQQEILCEPLAADPLLIAIPEKHPLSDIREELSIGELQGEPLILFPRHFGPDFYDQILRLCGDAGFSPEVSQEAIQMTTIVSLVSAGLGLAIVPGSVSALRLRGVVFRPLVDVRGDQPSAGIYVCRPARDASSHIDRAIDVLREAARNYLPYANSW